HKHVYLMERQPGESVRNNSIGTRLLAKTAVDFGCESFVLVSTDKAINPTNVMGASKRMAELHLQALNLRHCVNGGGASVKIVREAQRSLVSELESKVSVSIAAKGETAPSVGKGYHIRQTPFSSTKLMAVRFGNVLGSSGSV